MCRMGALELSELRPIFDQKYGKDTIGMYGIGVEFFGYEDFKKGKFFNGKLYVDDGKTIYQSLGYHKKGVTDNFFGLFESGVKERFNKAKEMGVQGNLKGDGFQLGGTVVVDPKGEVLYHKPQEYYGDDPKNETLLKVVEEYMNSHK